MKMIKRNIILNRIKGIVYISLISIFLIQLIELNLSKELKETTIEVNNQISKKISLDIDNNMDKLSYIDRYIKNDIKESKNKYDENGLLRKINTISDGKLFKYIGVVNKGGYINFGKGKKVYVGDRRYFKDAILGNDTVSDVVEDRFNHEASIVYSKPIIINNKIQGVIVGFQSKASLQKSLVENVFSNNTKVAIVDKTGKLLITSEGEETLYEDFIKKGISNYSEKNFQIFKNDHMKYVMSFDKIKESDWYVVTVASVKQAFKGTYNTIRLARLAIAIILSSYIILATVKDLKKAKQIKEMKDRDCLTKLRNAHKFKKDCSIVLKNSNKEDNYVNIVFDIKNLKSINELFGYSIGDKIVVKIADDIRDIEFENISGKIGEGIFSILFKIEDLEDLDNKIKYIEDKTSLYFDGKNKIDLELNVGVFKINDREMEMAKIIDNSNAARMESKKNRECLYYIYNDELELKTHQEIIIKKDLKNAFKNKEIELLYQPKVNIHTEEIESVEALIRWKHKTLGYISPAIFIPIAEKNGDINLIGRWVIKEVCKELRRCKDNNEKIVPVAINLSRRELYQVTLINYISKIIKKYDIEPELLEFEITETADINDTKMINKKVGDLRKLGMKIAIDDFGKGCSTLENLKNLEVDTVKIDRYLSLDIETSEKSRKLLELIINLAKEYNFEVVCEGIENMDQINILKNLNCNIVQGFVYYRPISIDKLKDVLNK
ncbi:signaling protein,Bacteriophytochrome cph2,cyclic-di-GMP phosphodiesterase,Predicted signal transduction protein containing sensor and EAL domains,diguanylate cyclase (GGDEF) domain,EAL domain [[Clostridium] sordellii]|nr:signaling protein,Bacteriophytochrome cph2,cyclic-di-GMP phosphodiesterase,Predicted signal transduction protein containing sensor and EAL domains,diguanylate cyclase (GGDEF) domain,EAL domain [[Clostridium] sordellii] [Paeniclostridium sordellii]